MSTGGLLFIPDISGFSRFVEKTEIEHSQLIIKNLLETLINCNQLQLQVSEVEGDAILFYKFGDPPAMKNIYQQVEKMFCDFHHLLRSMSVRRLCQCGACKEAQHLTLKIITHQGEFTSYNIKKFTKLIGKDVIRVHQLLKNDIEEHEYWLVTDNLLRQDIKQEELPGWIQWMPGSKAIENDQINFQYTFLCALKDQIPEESLFPPASAKGQQEVLSVSKEVQADFMQLFYLVSNFELRPQWFRGVKAIDTMGHQHNLVGVPHLCIFEKGSQEFVTSYIKATDTSISYEEAAEDKQMTMHYNFVQTDADKTLVTISIYLQKNFLKHLIFRLLMKKRLSKDLARSLDDLSLLYQKQSGVEHRHLHRQKNHSEMS